jgi:hypothetical protein
VRRLELLHNNHDHHRCYSYHFTTPFQHCREQLTARRDKAASFPRNSLPNTTVISFSVRTKVLSSKAVFAQNRLKFQNGQFQASYREKRLNAVFLALFIYRRVVNGRFYVNISTELIIRRVDAYANVRNDVTEQLSTEHIQQNCIPAVRFARG